MTELAQVRGMIETVLKRVDDLQRALEPKQAPLTKVAFAKLVGLGVRTVHRRIEAKEIKQLPDGRIPYSEARKYLS